MRLVKFQCSAITYVIQRNGDGEYSSPLTDAEVSAFDSTGKVPEGILFSCLAPQCPIMEISSKTFNDQEAPQNEKAVATKVPSHAISPLAVKAKGEGGVSPINRKSAKKEV